MFVQRVKSCGWIKVLGLITCLALSLPGASESIRAKPAWDGSPSTELVLHPHPASVGDVNCVAFSPDGRWLATGGSADHRAKLWDVETGEHIRTFSGHGDWILSVAFSPDGCLLLTGSGYHDRTARLWDVETGAEVKRFTGHTWAVFSVAFSPDGDWLLTGSGYRDPTARVWDAGTGDHLGTFITFTEPRDHLSSAALSPDGRWVVTSSDDNTAKLWNVETGLEVRTLSGHDDDVNSMAFSPDGQWVVTGGERAAMLWDVDTGKPIRTFRAPDGVLSLAFSPDGRWILSGVWDKTAVLWDAHTGEEIATLCGHTEPVICVAFSPDGQKAATGSRDDTARTWDLSPLSAPTPTPTYIPTPAPAQPSDRVDFAIQVFNACTLEPVSGVLIVLEQPLTVTLTSANGVAVLRQVPVGIRRLTLSKQGYAVEHRDIEVRFGTLATQILMAPEGAPQAPTPGPTATPGTATISPVARYTFDGATAAENDLVLSSPGAAGEFDLGYVTFAPLSIQTGEEDYTDGFGIYITLDGGQGATFFGTPVIVEDDYVLVRVSAWTNGPDVSLAVGALDAVAVEDLSAAHLNGSVGVNILTDAQRFLDHFSCLEAFYQPERGAVVPVFQAANRPDGQRVTLQFDNLLIYRIPRSSLPTFSLEE